MTAAYIGLGSNLEQPDQQIANAIRELGALPDTRLIAASSLYQSAPVGPQDQPDFINAVALIETALTPLTLLDQLQCLEQQAGRVRLRHWGERTLDLDILLFGNEHVQHPRLTVPHKEMKNRAFVLLPLTEIAPDLRLPCGNTVASLLALLPAQAVTRLPRQHTN